MESRQETEELSLFEAQSENTNTFTVDTSNNEIDCVGHGLSNGDCVTVKSGTTLPSGLSADTYYFVINSATDKFQISTTPGGTAVSISDTGSGTHTWGQEKIGIKVIDVSKFQHILISLDIDSSPDLTLKVVGSIMDSKPSLLNPQSKTNRYEYIASVDQQDGSDIAGDTGIAFSGEDHRLLRINVDGLNFITLKTLSFFGGDVTAYLKAYNNG